MAGQDLTSRSVPFAVKSFSGGLNSTFSPLALQLNESSDLKNVDFDKSGSVKKRKGYSALNTSAFNSGASFTGLHWYEPKITGSNLLYGVCGNKIAKMDSLDGTWDDITNGLTVTAGDDNLWNMHTFLDTVVGCNGVDAPWKSANGAGASALTLPTNVTVPKFYTSFQNYPIIANYQLSGTKTPSALNWGTINTLNTWTATDVTQIAQNDGQEITGLKVLGEELIIFKNYSIHKALFTGDPDVPFVFRKTRSHVGCQSHYSIQEVDNGLFFLSQDGFYFFDGNYSYKVSDRITATLDGYNKNRFSQANSIYLKTKNRYYCSFSAGSASQHDRVAVWDSFNNAWSLYQGIDGIDTSQDFAANAWTIIRTAGEERIYFGDFNGFVYRADNGTSDNPQNVETAIHAYYYTKWLDYEDIVNQKGTEHTYIYYQTNDATLTFAYSYDFEQSDTYSQAFSTSAGGALYGSAIYGTATYAASGGKVQRLDLIGRGRVIRCKFENNILDEEFQIDGIGMLPYLETEV